MFNLKILCSAGALLLCAGYAQGMSPDSSFNSSLVRRNSLPVSSRDWKDVALQFQNQLVQKDAKIAGLQQQLKGKDFLEKNFEEERGLKNLYGEKAQNNANSSENTAVTLLYKFCKLKNLTNIKFSFSMVPFNDDFKYTVTINGAKYDNQRSFKSRKAAEQEIARFDWNGLMKVQNNKNSSDNADVILLCEFFESKNITNITFSYDFAKFNHCECTVTVNDEKDDRQLFYHNMRVAEQEIARFALNELMKVQDKKNSSDNTNTTLLCEFYKPKNLTDITFSYDFDEFRRCKCIATIDGVKYDNQLSYHNNNVAKQEIARFALNELMKAQNNTNDAIDEVYLNQVRCGLIFETFPPTITFMRLLGWLDSDSSDSDSSSQSSSSNSVSSDSDSSSQSSSSDSDSSDSDSD